MKKFRSASFIAAVLAAAVMIVSAAGCSKDKTGDETTTENTGYTEDAEQSSADTAAEDNTGTTAPDTETVTSEQADTTDEQTTAKKTEQESSKVNEETTKATASNEKPEQTTKTTNSVPSKSEFDMLIGDSFYITGKTIDDKGVTEPLEMAKTSGSIYFLSDLDGVTMGAIMTDKTAYMICDEKQAYLEVSLSTLKTFGIDSSMTDISSYSFSDLKSLSNAGSVKENCDFYGSTGTEYTFKREKSIFKAYMNGTKLLGFTTANTDGTEPKTTVISTITSSVPSDKITPPSGYKKYKGMVGALGFMNAIGKN